LNTCRGIPPGDPFWHNSVQDSLGGTVTSAYDANGNWTTRSFSGPNSQQMRVDRTYDANGNLLTETRYANTAGTQKVGFTQYTYDGNLFRHIQHQNGSGTVLADYQYTYDQAERLASENDNGTVTSYTYDTTSQLTKAGSTTYTGAARLGSDEQGGRNAWQTLQDARHLGKNAWRFLGEKRAGS
jgi:YD repeat-containing protein